MKLLIVIYEVEGGHAIGFIVPSINGPMVLPLLRFADLTTLEEHGNKIQEYVKIIKEGGIPPSILDAFKVEEE